MKKTVLIILLTLLAGSLSAQISSDKLLQEVQQKIATAQDLLRLFPNAAADGLIQQALSLFEEGKGLTNAQQPRLAQLKLRLALERAQRAIDLLSTVPTQRSREEVEELLRRAEQTVAGSGNKEAERHLNSARHNLNSARQAGDRGELQKSGEYLRLARFYVERALALVESKESGHTADLQSERTRFEELLQRTREAVAACSNPAAQRLLLQAQQETANIFPLLQRGENKIALNLYANATRLLLRALDLCSGVESSTRDQLTQEFSLLEEQIAQARDLEQGRNNQQERTILDKVLALQTQTRRALDSGQSGMALRKMELIRLLLNRIWNPGPIQDTARLELQRLQQEIESARRADSSPSRRSKGLLRAAENQAAEAERFLQRGRTHHALAAILAGNRFLTLAGGCPLRRAGYFNSRASERIAGDRGETGAARGRECERHGRRG